MYTPLIKKHILTLASVSVIAIAGCSSNQTKEGPATGTVNVIIEKEVSNEKTGEISIQAQRIDEIAERSIADKGAESLLTPQRFVNVGASYFSSYAVGPENEILVSIYNKDGQSGSDLWVYKNGKVRLTKTNYFNQHPSFSADGKNVYFAASRGKKSADAYDQNSYIWRMPSNGAGGLTRIGTPVYQFLNPQESPDGTKILFSSREFFENSPFIWYMKKNGALPTQLKQGTYAEWLDDETIIFSAKDENTGLFAIWKSNIDGSNLTQIIADNEMDCISPTIDPTKKFVAYVKQAPKGNKVEELQSRDVHVFQLDDALSQQITTNISRDDMPKWSPDGGYLYFRSSRGLAWNVWRLSTGFLVK